MPDGLYWSIGLYSLLGFSLFVPLPWLKIPLLGSLLSSSSSSWFLSPIISPFSLIILPVFFLISFLTYEGIQLPQEINKVFGWIYLTWKPLSCNFTTKYPTQSPWLYNGSPNIYSGTVKNINVSFDLIRPLWVILLWIRFKIY